MWGTFSAGPLAKIISILALFCMFVGVRELVLGAPPTNTARPTIWLASFAASTLLYLLADWLKSRSRAVGEAFRTARAQETFLDAIHAVADGKPLPVTLYLRPFKLTNQLRYHNPAANLVFRDLLLDEKQDIERILAEAVEDEASLVGLGRPGEHEGAGRIRVTDEQWRDAVKVLAATAERIVLMPYPAEGTLWEVEHVFRSKLLQKVVFFLMPPAPPGGQAGTASFWSECKSIVKDRLAAELPPYDNAGALFTMTDDGRIGALAPLFLWASSRVLKDLQQLAPVVPGPLPDAELQESARRLAMQFSEQLDELAFDQSASELSDVRILPVTTRDMSSSMGTVTVAIISALLFAGGVAGGLPPEVPGLSWRSKPELELIDASESEA